MDRLSSLLFNEPLQSDPDHRHVVHLLHISFPFLEDAVQFLPLLLHVLIEKFPEDPPEGLFPELLLLFPPELVGIPVGV